MSEPNRSVFARVKRACLWVSSVLLGWRAPESSPHSRQGQWRLDTETAGKLCHAATVAGEGASTAAPAAAPRVASLLVETAPILVTVLGSDNAVGELEKRLWECAQQAERRVNTRFGGRAPTRAECGEEVVVEGCPQPITRAMQLGQLKHALALECAREVLEQLWPRPFRLEQRYRYYRGAQFLEMVSREEEARLIAQGCTSELWRTIKPDMVLYADDNWRRAAFTLDLKFPCPDTNDPRWRDYGGDSAYKGSNQKQIYWEALGTEPMMLSPRKGFSQ